jgi:hypothetical protein
VMFALYIAADPAQTCLGSWDGGKWLPTANGPGSTGVGFTEHLRDVQVHSRYNPHDRHAASDVKYRQPFPWH